jgi:hypothetical protein
MLHTGNILYWDQGSKKQPTGQMRVSQSGNWFVQGSLRLDSGVKGSLTVGVRRAMRRDERV